MGYSMDPLKADCYKGSTILINKFDIRDEVQLDAVERSITSGLIAKAMMDIPFENVDFEFYKSLHKFVFGDIYEWAGTVRMVDISKKGTSFCAADKISQRAERIFLNLQTTDYLKTVPKDEFINEFADLYCNLNNLHPFREGNGRIQRLFLNMLLEYQGKTINFANIDKDLLMIATIKSVSGDVFMLRDIFSESIKSITNP